MPQMAPLSWLLLFLVFIITYILFNLINYYMFLYEPKSKSFKKKSIKIDWKW